MARLSISQLEGFIGLTSAPTIARHSTENPEGQQGDWQAILAGCSFARAMVSRASALPEPEWYALAGLLTRCVDGRTEFHALSSKDPRYDRGEADAKFEQAREASPPRTCRSIAEDFGHDGCLRCPFWMHA